MTVRDYCAPWVPVDVFIPLPKGPLTCAACGRAVGPHECARDYLSAVCWGCGGYETLQARQKRAEAAKALVGVLWARVFMLCGAANVEGLLRVVNG